MKLVKRVDLILFPIICGIFVVCGMSVYSDIEHRTYSHYEAMVHNSLENAFSEAQFEFSSIKKTLSLIQNSPEFTHFITNTDRHYQTLSVVPSLYALIERSLEDTSIHSFYVTDPDRNVLLDFEKSDVRFAKTSLKSISREFVERCFRRFQQSNRFEGLKKIEYSEETGFDAVYAKSASVELQNRARQQLSNNANQIAMFLVSEFDVIDRLSESLGRFIDPGYQYRFKVFPDSSPISDPVYSVKTVLGDITGKLIFSHYEFSLTVPKLSFQDDLDSQLESVLVTTVFAAIVSFAILRLLIHNQVINPIVRLTGSIHNARQSSSTNLEVATGYDEVSSLNNAYKELLNELQELANYDELTGLANRRSFEKLLKETLEDASRNNHLVGLLFIDLDNFKNVNDTYGHSTGDLLLKEFSKRVQGLISNYQNLVQVSDKGVVRFAGDEFAILMSSLPNVEVAIHIGEEILQLFDNDFVINGINFDVRASIGLATTETNEHDAETLVKNADIAMYYAKSQGRNRLEVHNNSLNTQLSDHALIEEKLKYSIAQNLLELVCMPIYNLTTRKIVGYEVLVRCPLLEAQNVGPQEFIPVAEQSNLIVKLDIWVAEHALKQFKQAVNSGFKGFVSINISAQELKTKNFADTMAALATQHYIDSSRVHLEVTETSLVTPDHQSVSCLRELRKQGFKVTLDDFGTGYTAFNQLNQYPVDYIKIDRSFVKNYHSKRQRVLIQSIIAIADVYKIGVIAEGIETNAQLEFMVENECLKGQGYSLSQPLSFVEFERLVTIEN